MNKKKVVAFVPIKLNSQRLPFKNKLPLGKYPLAYHICNTLLQVSRIDEVYVFCSNEEVVNYVPQGVRYLERSKELDGDLVKGKEIYTEFINQVESDIYILAHTTSPFLRTESIQTALDKMLTEGYDSALSVQKIQTFAWYDNKPINYSLEDIPRTQDIKPVLIETSGFFMFEKEIFTEYGRRIGFKPYLQEVNGMEAIDIDTKEDYDFALKLVK